MANEYATMSLDDLDDVASNMCQTPEELSLFLSQLAEIAAGHSATLATLMFVISEEPEDMRCAHATKIAGLGVLLHPDTDGPRICRIAATAMQSVARAYE